MGRRKPKYCKVIYSRQVRKLSRTAKGRKRLSKCGIRPKRRKKKK